MKLLKTDRGEGYARIEVENDDDLWYLKDIIGEGAIVRSLTQRTKIDGREKKTLKLSLRVEKKEYSDGRLRLTGEIEKAGEEVELGYHTFNIEPGKELEIWMDFSENDWNRLEEAGNRESYQVLFCLVEKGEANLFLVEESGITDLSKLSGNVPGKMYGDQDKDSFLEELREVLERSSEDVENIILAGPGFEKEKLYDELGQETREKCFLQDTSVTGKTGLNEAIKRGALEKVVRDSRIGRESGLVEDFLEELERDGKASYGEPVKELAERGAVETLIITQNRFREEQDLVETVENNGGEVETVHTDHEAGERLENFGGIAALLRYSPG